jgi:hypothetical protein
MKKTQLYCMAATAAISMGLAMAQGAGAQTTIDNNFNRDRSTAVNERAKTDFQPLGVRLGAFMAQPSLGVSLVSNDNVFYDDAHKKSDVIVQLTPGVEVASDWSRNALAFGISSAIDQYGSATTENSTAWTAHVDGRYDISSHANVFGSLSHNDTPESRGDPLANSDALKPVKHRSDVSNVGLTLVGNRLRLIAQIGANEESYTDVASKSVPGTTIDPNHLRDLTTTNTSVRVDYAVSPAVSVFVDLEGNRREYKTNTAFDSEGNIIALGTSFDLTKLLRGEVSVGSMKQKNKLTGENKSTYVNASVEWFPTELTTVTVRGGTSFTEVPSTGAPTALATNSSINIDHELLRNLIISGSVGSDKYEYKGIDRTDTRDRFTLAANYFLSRRVILNASFNQEQLKSRGAQAFNKPYKDNSVQVGIVLKY